MQSFYGSFYEKLLLYCLDKWFMVSCLGRASQLVLSLPGPTCERRRVVHSPPCHHAGTLQGEYRGTALGVRASGKQVLTPHG